MRATWLTAFLDVPAATHADEQHFWSQVTGWSVSPARGDVAEFTTLTPPGADGVLKMQRLDAEDATAGVHLDVHGEDVPAMVANARAMSAQVNVIEEHGYAVAISPGGFVHCFVGHPAALRPVASTHADGSRSLLDQICLDIPARRWDTEVGYWSSVLGLSPSPVEGHDEFARLADERLGLRVLLQRLDSSDHAREGDEAVRAHLDLAAGTDEKGDRSAEIERHIVLGAQVVGQFSWWSVMRDPAGLAYCITGRRPRR